MVVATTGSIGNDTAQVKIDAKKGMDAMKASSSTASVRASILEYNDRIAPLPDAKVLFDFTTITTAFNDAIDMLHNEHAWKAEYIVSDNPECLYDGLNTAGYLAWDSTARRVAITMGDSPGKLCDSGISLDDFLFLYTYVVIYITPTTSFTSRIAQKKVFMKVPVEKPSTITTLSTDGVNCVQM